MTPDRNTDGSTPRDPDADDGTSRFDRCAVCGDSIDTTRWHPLDTSVEDGTVKVYVFCTRHCCDEWRRTRESET